MVKLAGVVLLVLASSAMGITGARELKLRARLISDMLVCIEQMRGDICTSLTPMGEIISRLAAEAPGAAAEFFIRLDQAMPYLGEKSFRQLWELAVSEQKGLTDEAKSVISALGASLGRYDTDNQELALNRCIEGLTGLLIQERARAAEKGRLYTGLGLALGLLAAVVLI